MDEPTTLDLFRLNGHVALITGGSKGLGKEMALALAEAGAVTVVCSRNGADCEAVAAEIAEHAGRESLGLAADVTVDAEVIGLMQAVTDRFGRLDVLVNCAGINIRHPLDDFPVDEFRQVVETNLTGSWLCCRAAGPIMTSRKSGSVINVGSTLSAVGLAERSAYCSSKAGVVGMTRALALEWAPFGVRCNALCPGPFLTEINRPLLKTPDKVKSLLSQTAFNRWGEMREIRGAALFLASDASTYVTGTSLFVDGGWTAR